MRNIHVSMLKETQRVYLLLRVFYELVANQPKKLQDLFPYFSQSGLGKGLKGAKR